MSESTTVHLLITFSAPRFFFLLWLHDTEKSNLERAAVSKPTHFTRTFWHFIPRPELQAHYPATPRVVKAAKEIILPFLLWLGNLQFCSNHKVTNSLYITCSFYLCSCNIRCWVAWEAALEIFNEAKRFARPLTNSFLTNKKVQL